MPKYSQIEKNSESGGSDFHGDNKPEISMGKGKGNLFIPYQCYENLRKRYEEKNSKKTE